MEIAERGVGNAPWRRRVIIDAMAAGPATSPHVGRCHPLDPGRFPERLGTDRMAWFAEPGANPDRDDADGDVGGAGYPPSRKQRRTRGGAARVRRESDCVVMDKLLRDRPRAGREVVKLRWKLLQ